MKKIFCGENELELIHDLVKKLSPYAHILKETSIKNNHTDLPVYSFSFGEKSHDLPVLIFVGGVHGLEIIGTQLIVSYLSSLSSMLSWDKTFIQQLKKFRLIFYPCANPGGLINSTRSNPMGIDIMRNAPIDAKGIPFFHLYSGHRITKKLPWYRGQKNAQMEAETLAICDFIRREAFESPFSLVVDIHSGFGTRDQIWFPYAYTKDVFPRLAEMVLIDDMLRGSFPQNVYKLEPQSVNYRAHGDLWDFLFLEHLQKYGKKNIFLPLCLELGSWTWVKKNPLQLFKSKGVFHPVVPHRFKRTLRRHLYFFDFLMRLVSSYENWVELSKEQRRSLEIKGEKNWYT